MYYYQQGQYLYEWLYDHSAICGIYFQRNKYYLFNQKLQPNIEKDYFRFTKKHNNTAFPIVHTEKPFPICLNQMLYPQNF